MMTICYHNCIHYIASHYWSKWPASQHFSCMGGQGNVKLNIFLSLQVLETYLFWPNIKSKIIFYNNLWINVPRNKMSLEISSLTPLQNFRSLFDLVLYNLVKILNFSSSIWNVDRVKISACHTTPFVCVLFFVKSLQVLL